MPLGTFVDTEYQEKSSVSPSLEEWQGDFASDVTIHDAETLLPIAGERELWALPDEFTPITSSGRVSVNSYVIGNFGLRLKDKANLEYTFLIPSAFLTIKDIIPVHAAGQKDWVAATWRDPRLLLFLDRCPQVLSKMTEIMKLTNNWDSYEGVSVPLETSARTIAVLGETFLMLHKISQNLPIPFIAPCPDGSIQLEWEKAQKELEIIIPFSADQQIRALRTMREKEEFIEETINSSSDVAEYLLWLMED